VKYILCLKEPTITKYVVTYVNSKYIENVYSIPQKFFHIKGLSYKSNFMRVQAVNALVFAVISSKIFFYRTLFASFSNISIMGASQKKSTN